MSHEMSETNVPIHTETRVPPTEGRTQDASTPTEAESETADEAIPVARIIPAAPQ